MTRTHDLLITNQLHYRLCYTSDLVILPHIFVKIKRKIKEILIFLQKYAKISPTK